MLQSKLLLLHFNLRPVLLLLQEKETSLFDLFLVLDMWLTICYKLQSSTAVPVISWFIISQSSFCCFSVIFKTLNTVKSRDVLTICCILTTNLYLKTSDRAVRRKALSIWEKTTECGVGNRGSASCTCTGQQLHLGNVTGHFAHIT